MPSGATAWMTVVSRSTHPVCCHRARILWAWKTCGTAAADETWRVQQVSDRKDAYLRAGRGLEYYDQCAVNKIQQAVEQDDYRFSRLVLEVVKSEPFQKQARKRSRE